MISTLNKMARAFVRAIATKSKQNRRDTVVGAKRHTMALGYWRDGYFLRLG